MNYIVKELRKSDLSADKAGLDSFEDLLETYNNLSPTPKIPKQKVVKYFDKIKKQWTVIFVAVEKKSKKIIWALTLLVEYKILRWWSMAWHIEDVVVRKWYEWLWIWSALMQKSIEKAKKLWCYKIILDCDDDLSGYYCKFWFEDNGTFMRSYL